jgi:transposase
LLKVLREAVYRAREGPGEDLTPRYQKELEEFRALCERRQEATHEKARALAVEFLNDWAAIFRGLAHSPLPLTNNEAEQALRHWAIGRRISQGTRTPVGRRAFAWLASVIETCRKRQASLGCYLAEVITQGRRGQPVPVLPTAA